MLSRMLTEEETQRITIASYILAAAALFVVLWLGLLPALLGGLLIYNLVIFGARRLADVGILPYAAKIILLVLITLLIVSGLTVGGIMFASYITEGRESVAQLFQKMADVVITGTSYMPAWTHVYLPANIEEWQVAAAEWLRGNARYFSVIGADAVVMFIHLIVGMIIGGMVAMHPAMPSSRKAPLAHAMSERVEYLGLAFRRIVFSQIRISGLNTILTGIFLAFIMPAMGYELPLVKTMIAVTFIVGLMPIIGNLISNTIIFLIALSVAPFAAVMALIYLVVIHKLEYFVNARIIGGQIRARAWEILLALLVMDAAFGIAGLVAAPIYYAYLKDELAARKLI
jgi:predicted PurR-regulated permease PerM